MIDLGAILGAVIAGIAIGGISGGLTAWVAFRIKFERFQAMDMQREKAWEGWRKEFVETFTKRLDAHAAELKAGGSFEHRIARLEKKVNGN